MGNVSKREPANGTAVAPQEKDGFSLISNSKLIDLYANLLKFQWMEQRSAAARKDSNKNGRARLRECAAGMVGAVIDLGPEDSVSAFPLAYEIGVSRRLPFATHGSLTSGNGIAAQNHTSLSQSGAARNGSHSGAPNPVQMHTVIGAALAGKTRNNGKVTVIFAHHENREWWQEAVQIASAHALPMIFVDPLSGNGIPAAPKVRTRSSKTAARPEGPAFPVMTVDRHDVVAIYRVASEAIARARKGRGPTLIECQPFLPSGTPPARANGKAKHIGKRDAVVNMENYLRGKGLFKTQLKSEILASLQKELEPASDTV